ncbi:HaaA family cyclophane-containing RiPP peptide [Streptomyces sp. SYSU K21746]
MQTRTTVAPSPVAASSAAAAAAPEGAVVLDRLAARVQARLAAEKAASNPDGGSHPASLIWPWPL